MPNTHSDLNFDWIYNYAYGTEGLMNKESKITGETTKCKTANNEVAFYSANDISYRVSIWWRSSYGIWIEFSCSLKLPPGSSCSCQYCHTQISLHNHSSFIHHEKHCLLNPSVSATCAVLHKHHSNGKFIDAEAMRTTSKRAKLRNAPLCMCAVDPERCLQMWSTSEGYRRKMYYCCSKFDKEDRCKFFKWCD